MNPVIDAAKGREDTAAKARTRSSRWPICCGSRFTADWRAAGQACPLLWLLLAEGHLNRKLFGQMLGRLAALPVPGG